MNRIIPHTHTTTTVLLPRILISSLMVVIAIATIAISICLLVIRKDDTTVSIRASLISLIIGEFISFGYGLFWVRPSARLNALGKFSGIIGTSLSTAAGLCWIHFQILMKDESILSQQQQQQNQFKLQIALVYLFIISTLLNGIIVGSTIFTYTHDGQEQGHDQIHDPEAILYPEPQSHQYWRQLTPPSSFNTVVHQVINNKDSLATLVNHQVPEQQDDKSSTRPSIPASSSIDNIQCFHVVHDTQNHNHSHSHNHQCTKIVSQSQSQNREKLLQKEKTVLAQLSNSLLPPHLQKGESDIIVHRKQSLEALAQQQQQQQQALQQQRQVIDSNIPQGGGSMNNNWNSSTTPGQNGKRFISLQDWEQQSATYMLKTTTSSSHSLSNLNLSTLEEITQDKMIEERQDIVELIEEVEEEEEECKFSPDKTPPPPALGPGPSPGFKTPIRKNSIHSSVITSSVGEEEEEESIIESIPSEVDFHNFDSLNSWSAPHIASIITTAHQPNESASSEIEPQVTPTNTTTMGNRSPIRTISRSWSRSRPRSRSKNNSSSSPIKRLFTHSNSTDLTTSDHNNNMNFSRKPQHYQHHQHSKSLYNFENAKSKILQLTTTFHQPSASQQQAQHTEILFQKPRRTKSLSPIKRDSMLFMTAAVTGTTSTTTTSTHMANGIGTSNGSIVSLSPSKRKQPVVIKENSKEFIFDQVASPGQGPGPGSGVVVVDDEEEEEESEEAEKSRCSTSPCPSGGFGQYDREKWKRIKLNMNDDDDEPNGIENELKIPQQQDHEMGGASFTHNTRKASGDIYLY